MPESLSAKGDKVKGYSYALEEERWLILGSSAHVLDDFAKMLRGHCAG